MPLKKLQTFPGLLSNGKEQSFPNNFDLLDCTVCWMSSDFDLKALVKNGKTKSNIYRNDSNPLYRYRSFDWGYFCRLRFLRIQQSSHMRRDVFGNPQLASIFLWTHRLGPSTYVCGVEIQPPRSLPTLPFILFIGVEGLFNFREADVDKGAIYFCFPTEEGIKAFLKDFEDEQPKYMEAIFLSPCTTPDKPFELVRQSSARQFLISWKDCSYNFSSM